LTCELKPYRFRPAGRQSNQLSQGFRVAVRRDGKTDILREPLRRREVLWHGITGAALICSFDKLPTLGARPSGKPAAARRREVSAPFEPFQRDLPIPRTLAPVERTRAREYYELTMSDGIADILPGFQTPVLGYDGSYPGPTIRASHGRRVEVLQTNATARELNVHLHGGVTPPDSDGHPADFIPAGGSRQYVYPNEQRAATLWYHDHAHGETHLTLYQGLAAFYLLDDERERKLGLPRGRYDVPLLIQDRAFNDDGSLRYEPNLDFGFYGDTILVNGQVAPRMAVKRRLYRLRLLNGSNARPYRLALGDGRPMIQIADDTGLLPKPRKRKEIPLQPAERVEVLVDFSRYRPGTKLVLRNLLGEQSTVAVMRFDVDGGGGEEEAEVPKRMEPRQKVPPPVAERTWTLDLHGAPTPQWTMGGLGFGMDRIDCSPRLRTTELWKFVNNSPRIHPMHLHGFHFHVISENGREPHPADRGWKDTVAVMPNETVVVRPYFTTFAGRYVFHCHAAEHGDLSMMGQMEVIA
jgi:spore coat protein A